MTGGMRTRRTPWVWLVVIALLLMSVTAARAGEARPMAEDPALEARVTKLAEVLRCLVCQNQTIADSNSGLATDLKNQIREQLRAGRSEQQVIDYMVERFGDFVLYRPPVRATTVLLWVGPFVLLAVGAWALVRAVRRQRPCCREADCRNRIQRLFLKTVLSLWKRATKAIVSVSAGFLAMMDRRQTSALRQT